MCQVQQHKWKHISPQLFSLVMELISGKYHARVGVDRKGKADLQVHVIQPPVVSLDVEYVSSEQPLGHVKYWYVTASPSFLMYLFVRLIFNYF